ncbi:MAG: hypothetical protein WBK20_01725 [Spirochaetota bacterium]
MKNNDLLISQPISRKQFMSILVLATSGLILPSFLTRCSSSNYIQISQNIRKRSYNKNNINKQLEIIHNASFAANGHNTQPWKFSISQNTIRLLPDFSRRLPVVDPDDRELFISLGCALENLIIAAGNLGFMSEVQYFPNNEPNDCIRINLKPFTSNVDENLHKAIPVRQSTRSEYDGNPVPKAKLRQLEKAKPKSNVYIQLFTDNKDIKPLTELVMEGNIKQYDDDKFLEELQTWIRFSDSEAIRTMDGLPGRCSGNPSVPRWFGKLFFNLTVNGENQAKTDQKKIRTSSGLALFISEKDDKQSWIETGRTFERFALLATTLNIKNAHLNQAIEVPDVRKQLTEHLNLGSMKPQLLIRFGYAKPLPYSLRRPVDQIVAI